MGVHVPLPQSALCVGSGQSSTARLTECEVPWFEDHSETFNDYICRVKTFSTFILPLGASTSLDLLTPLDPPK
jgi:hypothetical protein